jgi:hypothetical protein
MIMIIIIIIGGQADEDEDGLVDANMISLLIGKRFRPESALEL